MIELHYIVQELIHRQTNDGWINEQQKRNDGRRFSRRRWTRRCRCRRGTRCSIPWCSIPWCSIHWCCIRWFSSFNLSRRHTIWRCNDSSNPIRIITQSSVTRWITILAISKRIKRNDSNLFPSAVIGLSEIHRATAIPLYNMTSFNSILIII